MRKIGILSNDYIELEESLRECYDALKTNRQALHEAFEKYNQSGERADLLICESFRSVSGMDIDEKFRKVAKKINESRKIPLKESVFLSAVYKDLCNKEPENEINEAVLVFGSKNANIPESDEYYVAYNDAGKKNAIAAINEMREAIPNFSKGNIQEVIAPLNIF